MLELPPGWPQTAAEVAQIASMPGRINQRAEALLEPLRRVVPFRGAWISLFDPQRREQPPLVSQGYPDGLNQYMRGPAGVAEAGPRVAWAGQPTRALSLRSGAIMTINDLFFLIFLISFVQPLLQQRVLLIRRVRMMRAVEKERGSRMIALIHRQESLSFFGLPFARYIDIDDSAEVLRAIELTDPQMPIDLVLHTPGGLVLASEQIAWALRKHPAKVTVMVPHY
jgi:hypothetical protein